jgi:predicted dehydrogenase
MSQSEDKASRRVFAASALTAAAATRVAGANDRIRIGVIGAGGRGWGHIRNFSHLPDTEVVAVCDVYRTKAQRACAKENVSPFITQDHRRVLERKDIHAVVIATCDHSHVPLLVDALEAGKDVYVEKPLTFRMADGARVAEAVRRTRRVVQVGTQQKSGRRILEAKQRFIDSGAIGKISLVRTWWLGNLGYRIPVPQDFVYDPADLDWNRFLGPAPRRPFDAQRYFAWYNWSDYSTGQPGGLMVHTLDVVHTMLGLNAPSSVVASGGIYEFPNDRDMPDTISVLAEYPQNVMVSFDATLSTPRRYVDVEFHGSNGVLNIFRERYVFRPADPAAPMVEVKGEDCVPPHLRNFLNAMRSRKQPNSDVVYSHYLAAVCHMANMSCQTGQRVSWNREWAVPSLA